MTLKERVDRHDTQMAAIRDLVREGMRLMVETRKDLRKLAAAQLRTEATLEDFMRSMMRGGNGHQKRKID